jgi:hypothetical protein
MGPKSLILSAGKLDDCLRECIFVCAPYRTVTLRAAGLAGQSARSLLRHRSTSE